MSCIKPFGAPTSLSAPCQLVVSDQFFQAGLKEGKSKRQVAMGFLGKAGKDAGAPSCPLRYISYLGQAWVKRDVFRLEQCFKPLTVVGFRKGGKMLRKGFPQTFLPLFQYP